MQWMRRSGRNESRPFATEDGPPSPNRLTRRRNRDRRTPPTIQFCANCMHRARKGSAAVRHAIASAITTRRDAGPQPGLKVIEWSAAIDGA